MFLNSLIFLVLFLFWFFPRQRLRLEYLHPLQPLLPHLLLPLLLLLVKLLVVLSNLDVLDVDIITVVLVRQLFLDGIRPVTSSGWSSRVHFWM